MPSSFLTDFLQFITAIAMFYIKKTPGRLQDMSKADIKKIKAVAVELLRKVKDKIAELDHCWDKEGTRAEERGREEGKVCGGAPAGGNPRLDRAIISEYSSLI